MPPSELMQQIQRGLARVVPMTAIDVTGAKRLSVDNIIPNYLGQPGDEPQDFMYPFATLECTVFFDGDRKGRVVLMCPILKDR